MSTTTTKTNTPPAGTKTHKLETCRCVQCKAKRYDGLVTTLAAYKSSEATALKAFSAVQKERDEALLKITSLETAANWTATESEKIATAKENLWSDYKALTESHAALQTQLASQQIRNRALVSLFGTFDKGKTPPQESHLVTAVNALFLERDNARQGWERAQNNVERLKAESDRLSGLLGKTFTAMKNTGMEIEEYSDIPEAIEIMGAAAIDAEKEIAGLGKAADWWRGAAGWLGACTFAIVVASFWRLGAGK